MDESDKIEYYCIGLSKFICKFMRSLMIFTMVFILTKLLKVHNSITALSMIVAILNILHSIIVDVTIPIIKLNNDGGLKHEQQRSN